jgi:heme ABC exporter ATP-binding subunit CcmA
LQSASPISASPLSSGSQPALPAVAGLGISFSSAEKRYGPVRALRPTTLEISPGEFVALLGPNGSGKSTLLRLASLLARPTSGAVRFRGAAGEQSREAARRNLSMVAHATMLYDDLTAEENLQLFARLYGLQGAAAIVAERLEAAGLEDRRADLVRTFSRGMRQRLTLARALLHGPGLLLLDEPTTGLDVAGCEWLAGELRRLHHVGCTIVMSTHQGGEVLDLATRTLWLEAGRVVRDVSAPGAAN